MLRPASFTSPVNIARQYTRGVDFELNYTTRLVSRPLNLLLLGTYQPKNVYVDGITGVQTNNAGSGVAFGTNGNIGAGAKWRATLFANMEVVDGVRFSLQERYRGKEHFIPQITGTATTPATAYVLQNAPSDVPARWYTNVNLSFKAGPGEFYVNVLNLFDTQPAALGQRQFCAAGQQQRRARRRSDRPATTPRGCVSGSDACDSDKGAAWAASRRGPGAARQEARRCEG